MDNNLVKTCMTASDLQTNLSFFRRIGLKYNRLVQVNTMTLNSVLYDGSMAPWAPSHGNKPGHDCSFIFEGTQFISAGPTGWNICRFGVTLSHDRGDEFVDLRVYQYPKCNTDVKIAYDKLELRLAFLKHTESVLPLSNPEDEILVQADIKMFMGQKCYLQSCACRQEKREIMCSRNPSFMTISQLEKLIEPMISAGESVYYKINLFSSLDLCSHQNTFMEAFVRQQNESDRISLAHSQVMKKILKENLCADVKLKVGDIFLDCHRCILSGHSQVFDAMLQTDMKEKNSGVIDIVDLSENAAVALLNYLYHADISTISADPEIAFELLKAGEKYAISHLKETARECLIALKTEKIDIGFALEMFVHSRQFDEDLSLQTKSIGIIKMKSQELDTSNVFQTFLQENPQLGADLFKAVLKS